MSVEIVRNINVDFYNNKLITINAKQNDKLSRYILFTLYNQGELFVLDSTTQLAYIRYKKSDDNGVFNSCTITSDGKVLVELTEQMLAVSGNSYADIMIMDNDSRVLSTMNVCVNVIPSALDNTEIESSGEYNALYELMEKALADYEYVMEHSQASADDSKNSADVARSYAVGDTGTRDGEDTDNAKYYYERSKLNAYIDLDIASLLEVKNYLGLN